MWAGLEEKWPCAFQIIRNMDFTNAMIAEAAAKVDVDGMSPGEAAQSWLTDHEEVWKSWVPAECSA